ncbi:hypothetical protein EMIT0373P_20288 [Pseudomonas chlororaphis]
MPRPPARAGPASTRLLPRGPSRASIPWSRSCARWACNCAPPCPEAEAGQGDRQCSRRLGRQGVLLEGEPSALGNRRQQASNLCGWHERRYGNRGAGTPKRVFAQCSGLAIHAPVKSPCTGRTRTILIEQEKKVRAHILKNSEHKADGKFVIPLTFVQLPARTSRDPARRPPQRPAPGLSQPSC